MDLDRPVRAITTGSLRIVINVLLHLIKAHEDRWSYSGKAIDPLEIACYAASALMSVGYARRKRRIEII